ncbi:MAG: hypothetical protein GNW80_13120 [Asgard group archaeon]|nr:hypothetical protein [Asgard group archaeon]
MVLKKITNLRRNSFLILFRTFLRTNRKRFFLTILTASLIFILLTTFSIVWYNNREQAFQEYHQRSDWYDDAAISAYRSTVTSGEPDYSLSDITELLSSMKSTLNSIAPNLMTNNYSWLYAFQVYENQYNPILNNAYGYYTISDVMYELILGNLISGRMPTNMSEVLYYTESASSPIFEINDTVNLNTAGTMYPITNQQVTIVGIVSNLDVLFHQAGYSADIPNWEDYIDHEEFDEFKLKGKFISKQEFFFEFINNFPIVSSIKGIAIDINYNDLALESKELIHYFEEFSDFHGSWNRFSPFLDLSTRLNSYHEYWLQETNRILLLSLPIIFLLFLLIFDISNIDKKVFEQSILLLKNQGLEDKRIRKVILLEKSLFIFGSIFMGMLLGTIIGLVILSITWKSVIAMNIFAGLGESLFIIPTVILMLALYIGGYLFDNKLLKTLNRSKSELFKKQRTKRIKKIFTFIEVILLLPSSLCIGIGFLGLFLSYIGDWSPVTNYSATILFTSLIYFGFLVLGIIIFLLISKLVVKLWSIIGKKIWVLKKNLFTFSLKNFSMSYMPFRNIILSLMIFALAITPGLILNKSYPRHFEFESELRSGYSDLVISDWVANQTIRESIMAIDEIEYSAEVSKCCFELLIDPPLYTRIQVSILAINNITEFIQIISSNDFIDELYCSLEDIIALEINNTYLMDYTYSKNNGYDKDKILYIDDFTSTYYERFPLNYIASFKSFPLLSLPDNGKMFQKNIIQYNLVTNFNTLTQIKSVAMTEPVEEETYLLLKIEDNANLTTTKEQIYQETNLNAFDKEHFAEQINFPFIFWKQNIAILNIILSIMILCMFCYFLARNVYLQRIKIIESSTRVGAAKSQLLLSFLFEFIVASFVPILISIGVGLGLLAILMPMLFDFPAPYANFSWGRNWLYIFLIFPLELPLLLTYFIGLFPQIRNYKPIKEE